MNNEMTNNEPCNAEILEGPGERLNLCIFGSRSFDDYEFLERMVKSTRIFQERKIDYIVCGEARGADKLGRRFAEENCIGVMSFPADWSRYGKRAGFIRNEAMADVSTHAIAFWDGKSRGTRMMIESCLERGIKLWVINY